LAASLPNFLSVKKVGTKQFYLVLTLSNDDSEVKPQPQNEKIKTNPKKFPKPLFKTLKT
jgi:hypothetical protein